MSTHNESFWEKRDRQREQAERLMLVGLGILVAGVILIVGGNIVVSTLHLSARDVAYYWLIFPGIAVALFGGLLTFFSTAASLAL